MLKQNLEFVKHPRNQISKSSNIACHASLGGILQDCLCSIPFRTEVNNFLLSSRNIDTCLRLALVSDEEWALVIPKKIHECLHRDHCLKSECVKRQILKHVEFKKDQRKHVLIIFF